MDLKKLVSWMVVIIIVGTIGFLFFAKPSTEVVQYGGIHSMTVKDDKDFLENMIPHHQEAVDSAQMLVNETKDAEVKKLLTGIIAAQTKEIAEMKQWYKNWYGAEYVPTGKYMAMMRTPSAAASIAEKETMFLNDMIGHHEGAITMAESIVPSAQHKEIMAMAQGIIVAQQAEIEHMRQLLAKRQSVPATNHMNH